MITATRPRALGTSATNDDGALLEPDALARYADAIVRGSLGVRKGELLLVRCHPAHRAVAIAAAESAYRAGARFVDIRYDDPRLVAARLRHGPESAIGIVTPWDRRRMRELLSPDAATLAIDGEADPGVFDGIPSERLTRDARIAADARRPIRNASRAGKLRWAVASWPTAPWAERVYPDLPPLEGQRRLAEDLLWFCRLGPDDPPGHEGWKRHVKTIARRAKTLTRLRLAELELRGPGTDLRFRLAPETIWAGGEDRNAYGRMVAPNSPTEEGFTSPIASATEGTFRCSRPLSFRGRLIEGLAGEFRRGRLIRLEAAEETDREMLASFLHGIPNADRLGEVALVDSTSRIGQTHRIYATTLIDENAVAHIAFGSGFPSVTRPRDGSKRGVNKATFHLDVMIGTDDLAATGVRANGKRVPLIRDGLWQI
jgi:aminopeptidase